MAMFLIQSLLLLLAAFLLGYGIGRLLKSMFCKRRPVDSGAHAGAAPAVRLGKDGAPRVHVPSTAAAVAGGATAVAAAVAASRSKVDVPDVNVNVPDIDLSAPSMKLKTPDIDTPSIKAGLPEVDLAADIDVPKVSLSVPDVDVSVPDVSLKVPDVDVSVPDVSLKVPDVDVDLPEVSVPEVEGSGLLGAAKVVAVAAGAGIATRVASGLPDVDISVPDVSLRVPDVDISVPDVSLPDISLDVPSVNVDLPKVDVSVPDVSLKVPDVGVSVPDVSLKVPDVDVPDVSLKMPDVDVDVSVPDVSLDVPSVDVDLPDVDVSVPDVSLKVPDVDVDVSVPDVSVPDVSVPDVSLKVPDIDVDLPEVSAPEAEGSGLLGAAKVVAVAAGAGIASHAIAGTEGRVDDDLQVPDVLVSDADLQDLATLDGDTELALAGLAASAAAGDDAELVNLEWDVYAADLPLSDEEITLRVGNSGKLGLISCAVPKEGVVTLGGITGELAPGQTALSRLYGLAVARSATGEYTFAHLASDPGPMISVDAEAGVPAVTDGVVGAAVVAGGAAVVTRVVSAGEAAGEADLVADAGLDNAEADWESDKLGIAIQRAMDDHGGSTRGVSKLWECCEGYDASLLERYAGLTLGPRQYDKLGSVHCGVTRPGFVAVGGDVSPVGEGEAVLFHFYNIVVSRDDRDNHLFVRLDS